MLDIGFLEIGVVLIVALLVVGPERLPKVARMLGKNIARVRRMWTNVKDETLKNIEDVNQSENTSSKKTSQDNSK